MLATLAVRAPRTSSDSGALSSWARLDRAGAPTVGSPLRAMYLQDLIFTLQKFWADRGCVIEQPVDVEVGAGTFHPATFLRVLGPEPWNAAFAQFCRRPSDGRYGENPNRAGAYYQFQVGLKPSPLARPGALPRFAARDRPRSGGARHPLRRGRLGVADARRVGPRLGGLVRRHGGHAVHVLPAGRRHRSAAGHRGADLRHRAARDVPAGRRQHVRPEVGQARHVRPAPPAVGGRVLDVPVRGARRRRSRSRNVRHVRGASASACSRASGRSCCRRTSSA